MRDATAELVCLDARLVWAENAPPDVRSRLLDDATGKPAGSEAATSEST